MGWIWRGIRSDESKLTVNSCQSHSSNLEWIYLLVTCQCFSLKKTITERNKLQLFQAWRHSNRQKDKFFLKLVMFALGQYYIFVFFRKSFKSAIIGKVHASTFSSHGYFQPFFQSPGNRKSVASCMEEKFKSAKTQPSVSLSLLLSNIFFKEKNKCCLCPSQLIPINLQF